MTAYYNELDKDKAAWLRELIKAGLIAPGDVDERSIKDVRPADVMGYTQCHFFAGIGVWSYALRLAGWPDDRAVWTGSCPCPGFSIAGKGGGFADPRHLWPEWIRLIRECHPGTVFGEQADGAIGHGWLDLVSGDMEAESYAFAAAVLGAHSAGAPHNRQRLYFCAESMREPCKRRTGSVLATKAELGSEGIANGHLPFGPPDDQQTSFCSIPVHAQRGPLDEHGEDGFHRKDSRREETHGIARTCSEVLSGSDTNMPSASRLGPDSGEGTPKERIRRGSSDSSQPIRPWRGPGWLDPLTARSVAEAGATRGYWADCDWWYGRDGKCRPIGPGVQPLAHGVAARVVKLRGYGDAIVSETAKAFIEAYLDTERQ